MSTKLLDRLGGEQLKNTAPLLHQVLSNPAPVREKASNDSAGDVYLGTEAICPSEEGVEILLRAGFSDRAAFLVAVSELYDAQTGELLDTYNQYWENCTCNEARCFSDHPLVRSHAKSNLRLVTTYTWSHDGQTVHEKTRALTTAQFKDGNGVFVNLTVTAPRAKDLTLTKVLYDREKFLGDNIDYHYTNVVSGNRAKVMMPFEGSLQMAEGLCIRGIHTTVEPPVMMLLLSDGSSVKYGYDAKKFVSQFAIAPDGASMTWKFADDWNALLDLSHFSAKTIVRFSCQFTIKAEDTSRPGYKVEPMIMITSTAVPQANNIGFASVEPIEIMWGCVEAKTPVLMADGSERTIDSLRPGDEVKTPEGTACVTDCLLGKETELARLTTKNGRTLLMTFDHPVRTARGLLPAGELNAADTICTIDGPSQTQYLYVETGDFDVYSLRLEPSSSFYCGGIEAGDFEMQNNAWQREENKPDAPTELQKELRRIFGAPKQG